MRRGAIVRLVIIALLVGAGATAIAIFIPWLPENNSKEGERIDFVFWFTTAICIAIFQPSSTGIGPFGDWPSTNSITNARSSTP